MNPDEPRRRVAALLERFGRDATSFQVLEEGYRYAFFGDEACVAYVDTGGAWVAAGGPIAADDRLADVAGQFVREARAHRRRAVLFATDASFVNAAPAFAAIPIGQQAIWDPRAWAETLRHARSLREQLRRARAPSKGVRVAREPAASFAAGGALRAAVEALLARWLRARPLPPMGFLVRLDPFAFPSERRYYVARTGERIVGFLAMAPVYARRGWLLENLLRDPAAPNGTSEALFHAALADLGAEGTPYATLGLAPLAGDVAPWLRRARAWGRLLYDFGGLWSFKQKLRPSAWAPMFVAYPRGSSALIAIHDVLAAFTPRGFLRFGLATLLRLPALVSRALQRSRGRAPRLDPGRPRSGSAPPPSGGQAHGALSSGRSRDT